MSCNHMPTKADIIMIKGETTCRIVTAGERTMCMARFLNRVQHCWGSLCQPWRICTFGNFTGRDYKR